MVVILVIREKKTRERIRSSSNDTCFFNEEWLKFVSRVDWKPSDCSVICSDHFEGKYLLYGDKRTHLNRELDPVSIICPVGRAPTSSLLPFSSSSSRKSPTDRTEPDQLPYYHREHKIGDLDALNGNLLSGFTFKKYAIYFLVEFSSGIPQGTQSIIVVVTSGIPQGTQSIIVVVTSGIPQGTQSIIVVVTSGIPQGTQSIIVVVTSGIPQVHSQLLLLLPVVYHRVQSIIVVNLYVKLFYKDSPIPLPEWSVE